MSAIVTYNVRRPESVRELSALTGYTVPKSMLDGLNIIHQLLPAERGLYDLIGFEIDREPMRYFNTPPEMGILGWTGVDGEHLGHVDHAPELGRDDLPFARFCPMDSDGAYPIGSGSSHALQCLLDNSRQSAVEDEDLSLIGIIDACAQRLGFTGIDHATVWYDERGNGRPVPAAPRDGWRFLPTPDGIGIFAPHEQFHADFTDAFPEYTRLRGDEFRQTAAKWMTLSRPASALYFFKCLWWCSNLDADGVRAMAECYRSLGRDLHAERLLEQTRPRS